MSVSHVLEQVDPNELLIDANVRVETKTDAGFVARIRQHGVLQPIVGLRTADGAIRVRFGHRRTLAAVQARKKSVPVIVIAEETTDDDAQVERLLTQWAENEDRENLSTADKVTAIGQLTAFGVTPAQITKRLRAHRGDVDAALAVHGSDLARDATARYGFLDLTQAAVVAEFDDDPDAVTMLVSAARNGQFEHVAQRFRDARADAGRRTRLVQRLQDADITVLHDNTEGTDLDDLRDADGNDLDAEAHRSCPGHAARVVSTFDYVDPDTHEPINDEDDDNGDGDGDSGDGDEELGGGRRSYIPYRGCARLEALLTWAARLFNEI